MSSILTNNSAIVALQTLKSINSNLAKTQSEISTGKSVATAKDNAAIWATAKIMEGQQGGYKVVQSQLNVAEATVATARQGAERVTELLIEIEKLVIGATNESADHAKIGTDVAEKFKQIKNIIDSTSMNGVNLLDGEGTFSVLVSLTKTEDDTADMFAVANVNLAEHLGDDTAPFTITDAASARTALHEDDTGIKALINTAAQAAADLGSAGKRISDQANFVSQLADSLQIGVGSLVDADMEEASARLQALQTQQQLGIQSLSIANQAPQAILSLFR
ncbi:flagellin [Paracoccus sp. (in: a-proteobacteria)]|uniref:flagellin N-terminal helical domain-containing protein n=1 Tax=Paracoccus sp. TaxID=267 RepID=UPI0026E0FBFF|nr:flagellin [Paracoccus sp. (in: a-proteobacteria)]MDO5647422.1 flagellin [Paracoccus sp. (in: a-proteobacteria)]